MNTLQITKHVALRWTAVSVAIALAGAAALVPSYQAGKEIATLTAVQRSATCLVICKVFMKSP